jgi:hypothetical protein
VTSGRSRICGLYGRVGVLDLEVQDDVAPGGFGAAVAVLQFGGFGADLVQRGDAGGDEDVAADDGPFADAVLPPRMVAPA